MSRAFVSFVALLLATWCLAGCWQPVEAAKADNLDASIEVYLKQNKIPGASIVASSKGKILYAKGFGFANAEHQVPMKPESVHELASVSKQFTAACILLLKQDGKLALNDKLSKFFPGANPAWSKITILHLLNHTSGLADYLEGFDVRKDYTAANR